MENKLGKLTIPCGKCPYKLGIVRTVVNPCPQCKRNSYSSYKQFVEQSKRNEKHEN